MKSRSSCTTRDSTEKCARGCGSRPKSPISAAGRRWWVPGGFGVRGVEGMLEAIRWAREHKLPFFGICLGLQTAIIEFARNVCKIADTNSSEFAPECENPVIALMRSQEGIQEMGGTMRLGAYPCRLRPGSRVAQAYTATEVSERHRHRYEVSNAYRDVLAEYGLRASG